MTHPAAHNDENDSQGTETVGVLAPTLEPQPHGGALARGSKPASDRASIRAMLRQTAAKQYKEVAAQFNALTPEAQTRVVDLGFKYGLGTQSQALTPQAVEEQVKVLYDEIVGKLREMGFSDYSAWAWVADLTKRTKIAYARQEGLDGGEEAAPEVKATIQGAIAPPTPEEP